MRATPKEWQQLLTQVDATAGWSVAPARNGHVRITGPNGQAKQFGRTLSDWRAVLNNRADLRRLGWPDPQRQCRPALELPDHTPDKETTMTITKPWEDVGLPVEARAVHYLEHHPGTWFTRQELGEILGTNGPSLTDRVRERHRKGGPGVYQRKDPSRVGQKGLAVQFSWCEDRPDDAFDPRSVTRNTRPVPAPIPEINTNGTHELVLDRHEVVDGEQVWIAPDGRTYTILLQPVQVVRALRYEEDQT